MSITFVWERRAAAMAGAAGPIVHRLHLALQRAQVEEQLPLCLGGGDFHQPPIAQDVFLDLSADEVTA